jgi:rod shape-determining protein MreC
MPKKKTFLFLSFLVISFFLMTYQSRKGRLFSFDFIGGFLNGSHAVATSITDTLSGPFRKMALRDEENRRLKKEVGDLLLERQKYQEALQENRRLIRMLNLRETQRKTVATARVIARSTDHWSRALLLDKGSRDGVGKDMVAITPKGLAGKIFDVSGAYSHLLLLTDINFAAAVRLQESRREAVLTGTGTGKCVLRYVPSEEEVKPGEGVVTSGLDMLFPEGIPVGYVSKVEKRSGEGNFQYIEVVPYQDESKMEEALIVGR